MNLKSAQPGDINISGFNYHLPQERIAQYPLEQRDLSRLLIYKNNQIEGACFRDIGKYLHEDDLLIFNNTKVIPARIKFYKSTGAQIEIFCLEPIAPSDYSLAMQSESCVWKCIVGNLKKWKDSTLVKTIIVEGQEICLRAEKLNDFSSSVNIRFTWNNSQIKFDKVIESAGLTPIPPYLNRDSEEIDRERYQTVYSSQKGSVAAPTAGLHFTDSILAELKNKKVGLTELTLHVGAGTFKPVQTDKIGEHIMHTEFFSIKKESIETMLKHGNNLISVGTTSLRTLESLYWIAVKIQNNSIKDPSIYTVQQWEPYEAEHSLSYSQALEVLLEHLEKNKLPGIEGNTQIMIVPGYYVKSIKAIITNFHQPKSTLLLLIASLVGNNWKDIYQYALDHHYRFLSYGDSSMLFL